MNVKVSNLEKNVVKLEIEVDAKRFEDSLQKAYFKSVNKYNIPGFRKGKAPRNMIERYFGEEVLYEDAINILCPTAYDEAVEQTKVFPVDKPQIDIVQLGKGKNFIFTAAVTIKPQFEITQYKDIEVKKVDISVTQEDLENELKRIAEKNARLIEVKDRGIILSDIVFIDFEGFIDGVPFEGGKAENYKLEIGSNHFIAGFEDQLIGAQVGSEVEVNVVFPSEYHKKELSDKPAMFKVKVNEIKCKELPIIDDEFAKDVSEYDTLDEYKEFLMENLKQSAELEARQELEEIVMDKIASSIEIDIPDVIIEKHIDWMISEFDSNLRYQGFDINRYLSSMNIELKTLREQYRDRAYKEVKIQLILEKISNLENITVSDEELEIEYERLSKMYRQDKESLKKQISHADIDYITKTLTIKKTINFVIENTKQLN